MVVSGITMVAVAALLLWEAGHNGSGINDNRYLADTPQNKLGTNTYELVKDNLFMNVQMGNRGL